jgi:hypothetical protein
MAVISVIITESEEHILSGIPRFVSLSTNIPATIFYTLNGIDPTLSSDIYTDPIYLPTDKLSITIKVLATNGSIFSPIVSETYETNMLENTRLPHSATDAAAGSNLPNLYPFGTNPIQPTTQYLNPGDAGVTVDNPTLSQIPNAFDGSGNPTTFTNEPYTVENYSIKYSTTDFEGRTGNGVGNLPANITIKPDVPVAEETQQFSKLFDPRALVIFQDFSKENPEDPACINRQFFSLEDIERVSDGGRLFNSGLDAATVSGSFLRSHYNPRDNTMTYYYLDTHVNKWIISTAPYTPTGGFDGNLSTMALSRNGGAGIVVEWLPFTRRILF